MYDVNSNTYPILGSLQILVLDTGKYLNKRAMSHIAYLSKKDIIKPALRRNIQKKYGQCSLTFLKKSVFSLDIRFIIDPFFVTV